MCVAGRYAAQAAAAGDSTWYAASNVAFERGDVAAAARLWHAHCALESPQPHPQAGTLSDARLAACLLRSATVVAPAGPALRDCPQSFQAGRQRRLADYVTGRRWCDERDVGSMHEALSRLRSRVIAANVDPTDAWAIGDPLQLLRPTLGGYLSVPTAFAA